jgi:serine/threonine protein phosphatase 1
MDTFNFCDVISPGDVIAVGDIHACAEPYLMFLDWVRDSGAHVILLGDLIDRGGDDLIVLELTRSLLEDPTRNGLEAFTVIRGNHEQMFLNAVESPQAVEDWIYNGGNVKEWLNLQKHVEWLQELPYYVVVGDTLFTHAGCPPGQDPQTMMGTYHLREKFLWMRRPFLDVGPQFEAWNPFLNKVVFGHTPESALPYRIPNGICIDTAAFKTGVLTAYNATQDTFFQIETDPQ